jgi:translation initiation factor 5A
MVRGFIDGSHVKPGTTIIIEGVSCIARSNDISKTGKHGHAKCRMEAIGIIDGKKRVIIAGGHDRFECPMIKKDNGQILSIMGNTASIMDLKSFETLEVPIPEELKGELKDGDQVEYWDIEGIKMIKRKM